MGVKLDSSLRLSLIVATIFATSVPAFAEPPPPTALTSYMKDGVLSTTDVGWLRGAFANASEQQKADWATIDKWMDDCSNQRTATVKAELAAMGTPIDPQSNVFFTEPNCRTVISYKQTMKAFDDWDKFSAAIKEAAAKFDLLMYGAKLGAESTPFEPAWVNNNTDAIKLMGATRREQVYRSALSWPNRGDGPPVDEKLWPVIEAIIGITIAHEDRKNTEMLKAHLAEHGWPTISAVGGRASDAAWLLVQHADSDPAFQLKALRLMEPLAAKGDVSKKNFAYLYDRIMLQTSGKQRFGTQFGGCKNGDYKLRPLEDAAQLDRLRAEYDLPPMADYRNSMVKTFGPCKDRT